MNDLTHIDLFSGIGGFALAAQWAGFRTIAFCEVDGFCKRILRKHWPNIPIQDDIRTFRWGGGQPTLITGGPPCQRTSVAAAIQGTRTGETLWPEMARIVTLTWPSWVIVEQPPGNEKWEGMVTASLESIGYHYSRFEREASHCGAPHCRRRVFIVANASSKRLYAVARFRRAPEVEQIAWPPPPRGTWRATRTGNCGMDDGISDWVDRLKALGNAVVPQVAYQIIKAIAEIEKSDAATKI